jgi:hypothetical protein
MTAGTYIHVDQGDDFLRQEINKLRLYDGPTLVGPDGRPTGRGSDCKGPIELVSHGNWPPEPKARGSNPLSRAYGGLHRTSGSGVTPLHTRFWSLVDRSGSCWLWRSVLTRDGHGQVKVEGRVVAAHPWEAPLQALPDPRMRPP